MRTMRTMIQRHCLIFKLTKMEFKLQGSQQTVRIEYLVVLFPSISLKFMKSVEKVDGKV